jgi:hypothetical protein
MTAKKVEKQLTMRQQLRVKAEAELVKIQKEALATMGELCKQEGLDRAELIKSITVASHKTADHFLVTQLANRYEAELVALWNKQDDLPLGDDK